MTEIPNRIVEMYRISDGDSSGDSSGTWDTVMVELPASTHDDKLEAVARIHAEAQFGSGAYMIYNSMDDECPVCQSEIVVKLCFEMGQITEGSEAEQQKAAVEVINLTLQREPYGLGAQIFMLDE